MGTVDLHELRVYQLAMRVGEDVWSITAGWEWLAKQTIGLQWIRSADSIAANISEGYGRYSFKENAKFCYYARGSLRETQTWLEKAVSRHLLSSGIADDLALRLETLRRQLDNYIHSLGRTSGNVLREESPETEVELPPLEEFLASRDPARLTNP
ncbi:MAG: four helix bundle protein [Prosthecobacter sp.]|jgi:four helix bundle protein|uniref:four helix bundle protein n=1 Tax=Prosthecobacter sp. TaxID=1965333 RepID=UPI0019FFA0DD|nr:four helix bundle protein [Prosthecobacter sp.]MBE2286602.1 four helix bundle protein [Prosthecobacter sp.]